MADDSLDEISMTEDEMLAQAIALSLNPGPTNGAASSQQATHPPGRPPPPLRSNTTQSTDSALTEGSFLGQQSRQISRVETGSTSSSPDLGISGGESEMEQSNRPDEGTAARHNLQAAGGRGVNGGSAAAGRSDGAQLPFARLSSLHEPGQAGGGIGGSIDGIDDGRVQSPTIWQPNKDCLELIIGMGISENAAKRALFQTGNDNAELAVAWVFENISDPQLHEPFEPPPLITFEAHGSPGPVYHSFDAQLQEDIAKDSYKMVFVVNTELKMSTGKIAAQVGHATLGLYRLIQDQQEYQTGLVQWEKSGCKKVVVKGESVRQLLDLKKAAYELHIANIMVHDAGRTQVDPGSLTVFAVFGRNEQIDPLTGGLKLL